MKTILFSILILFSINGFAFNWKKVAESGNSYYIDVDNIKKRNGIVYYWQLDDYLEPLDEGINSNISKYRVNCVEETRTWLSETSYSLSMGKGRIIFEDPPNKIPRSIYPKPNTVAHIVMKLVCNY
jgi:hypothetical protein|tara:strand:+ start:292 stop:669 length:378 start_codon:yes stop_codon:yes gene_type:complete